jgi:hypothetical protein
MRSPIQPFPFVDTLAKHCAEYLQRPVDRRIAQPQRSAFARHEIDDVAIDGREIPVTQVLVEPAQLGDVLVGRCLVTVFLESSHHPIVLGPSGPGTELVDAPQLGLDPIVKLLR